MATSGSIFDQDEFRPYAAEWKARQTEFFRRQAYYTGEIYRRWKMQLLAISPRVYQGTKPLYLPLARAVDVDCGIIPGGWQLDEDIPETLEEAVDQVLVWSSWDTDGVLFVHHGAQFGNSGLKIVDDRQNGVVQIKPVSPMKFMLIDNGIFDGTPAMSIFVEQHKDADGEPFEFAEVITPERIRTYKAGELAGFDDREQEYANELKFVPYIPEVRHIETGERFGEATFQKVIPMLDEVNQLASYLGDIIAKHAEPQWAVFGAEASDMFKSGDNVWFFPQGSDSKPLVAPIDVTGVLSFIQEIAQNVKDGLPELAFDDLREKTQIATATLELQLMELVLKIQRSRPNYDKGLIAALRMAGRAARTMEGEDLSEIAALDTDELAFDSERPVLPLDPLTAIELEMQELVLERERAQGIREGIPNA